MRHLWFTVLRAALEVILSNGGKAFLGIFRWSASDAYQCGSHGYHSLAKAILEVKNICVHVGYFSASFTKEERTEKDSK